MPTIFNWSETLANMPGQPVPQSWLHTQGNGVKAAFIDTGANLGLPSLRHLNIAGRKFSTAVPSFSPAKLTGQDPVGEAFGVAGNGHGTLYTSLLAGKSPDPAPADKDLVLGIAPAAEWYIIRATDATGELTTTKNLLDAFELCANLGIEIAITGQCISLSEMQWEGLSQADLDRVFGLPGVQKMKIFAPLKNRVASDSWTGITTDNFPSCRPEVFNIAVLPDNFAQLSDELTALPISYFLSGFSGTVLGKFGTALSLRFSNSAAVAIAGGIAVLTLSHLKETGEGVPASKNAFAQTLNQRFRDIGDAFGQFNKPAIFFNA